MIRCVIIQSIYSLAKNKAGNSSDSKTSRLKQLECNDGSSQPGNEEHSHPESRPYGLNQMRKKDNDQMMMMMMTMIHVYKAW